MKKIKEIYDKNRKIIFCSILLLSFLLIYLINYNTVMAADDYAFYNHVWTGINKFDLSRVWSQSIDFYLMWTGRFLSTFINYILLAFSKNIFNIFNSLFYVTYLYAIYTIANKDKQENPILFSLIFILVWFFIPQICQVMFWQIGSVIYLWTMTMVLLFLIPFIRLIKNPEYSIKKPLLMAVLIFIFGIITGNGFETNSLMLLIAVVFIFIFKMFIKKVKMPIWSWTGFAGLLIGFLSNFLSPGNAVRMQSMGSNESLIIRILSGLGSFFYRGVVETKVYIIVPLIISLYLIYLFLINSDKKTFLKKNIIFIGSLVLFSVCLFGPCLIVNSYTLEEFLGWFYVKPNILGIYLLFAVLGAFLCIILGFIYRKRFFINTDEKINSITVILTLSAIAGIATYIITPFAWSRSYMGMITFLLIVVSYLLNNLPVINKILKYSFIVIFMIGLGLFILTYASATKDLIDSKKWQLRTKENIKEQILAEKEYILVETYISTNRYNAASVEKWVIPVIINEPEYATENGIDKNYEWINIAITNYYYNDNSAWANGRRIIGYEKK